MAEHEQKRNKKDEKGILSASSFGSDARRRHPVSFGRRIPTKEEPESVEESKSPPSSFRSDDWGRYPQISSDTKNKSQKIMPLQMAINQGNRATHGARKDANRIPENLQDIYREDDYF